MEAKPKTKTTTRQKLLIALVLVLLAFLLQALWPFINTAAHDLHMTQTDVSLTYHFDTHAAFYSYDARSFYFVGRYSVQLVAATGEVRWQRTTSLTRPLIATRGPILAASEAGGRSAYVFDAVGLRYQVAFEDGTVLYFAVNASAYLSVILLTESGYEIRVYNPGHTERPLYRRTIPYAGIFPVSVDVSEDGRVIALSLLETNTMVNAQVQFGFIRAADGRDLPHGVFASQGFPAQFAYRVRFTLCEQALVFTDTQIIAFGVGAGAAPDLTPQWHIPLYNYLEALETGTRGFVLITGDPFLNQPDADAANEVHFYNLNGQRTAVYPLGRRPTHLSLGPRNAALVGMGRTFYAIDAGGSRLWTYTALQDVRDFIFLGETDTVLLAGAGRANVMRRLRVAASPE